MRLFGRRNESKEVEKELKRIDKTIKECNKSLQRLVKEREKLQKVSYLDVTELEEQYEMIDRGILKVESHIKHYNARRKSVLDSYNKSSRRKKWVKATKNE